MNEELNGFYDPVEKVFFFLAKPFLETGCTRLKYQILHSNYYPSSTNITACKNNNNNTNFVLQNLKPESFSKTLTSHK